MQEMIPINIVIGESELSHQGQSQRRGSGEKDRKNHQ
jgi:hypothetical protein